MLPDEIQIKIKDIDIPCKECITFPLCKNQVLDFYNSRTGLTKSFMYYNVLRQKCSILYGWVEKLPLKYRFYNGIDHIIYDLFIKQK